MSKSIKSLLKPCLATAINQTHKLENSVLMVCSFRELEPQQLHLILSDGAGFCHCKLVGSFKPQDFAETKVLKLSATVLNPKTHAREGFLTLQLAAYSVLGFCSIKELRRLFPLSTSWHHLASLQQDQEDDNPLEEGLLLFQDDNGNGELEEEEEDDNEKKKRKREGAPTTFDFFDSKVDAAPQPKALPSKPKAPPSKSKAPPSKPSSTKPPKNKTPNTNTKKQKPAKRRSRNSEEEDSDKPVFGSLQSQQTTSALAMSPMKMYDLDDFASPPSKGRGPSPPQHGTTTLDLTETPTQLLQATPPPLLQATPPPLLQATPPPKPYTSLIPSEAGPVDKQLEEELLSQLFPRQWITLPHLTLHSVYWKMRVRVLRYETTEYEVNLKLCGIDEEGTLVDPGCTVQAYFAGSQATGPLTQLVEGSECVIECALLKERLGEYWLHLGSPCVVKVLKEGSRPIHPELLISQLLDAQLLDSQEPTTCYVCGQFVHFIWGYYNKCAVCHKRPNLCKCGKMGASEAIDFWGKMEIAQGDKRLEVVFFSDQLKKLFTDPKCFELMLNRCKNEGVKSTAVKIPNMPSQHIRFLVKGRREAKKSGITYYAQSIEYLLDEEREGSR